MEVTSGRRQFPLGKAGLPPKFAALLNENSAGLFCQGFINFFLKEVRGGKFPPINILYKNRGRWLCRAQIWGCGHRGTPTQGSMWSWGPLGTGFGQGYVGYSCSLFSPGLVAPEVEGRVGRRSPGLTLFLHLCSKNGRISDFFWLPPFLLQLLWKRKGKIGLQAFFFHLLTSVNCECACWWHRVWKPERVGAVQTRVH